MEENLSEPVEYILVALDMSQNSEAALVAAAELASALHIELRGLYVEDVNLLRLCGLPFGFEYGSFTAKPRRMEQAHLEREFQIQASLLRKIMADIAGQRRVNWSFQVVRGGVTDQLLEAAASARMLSLGRVGRSPGKRIGSTAQAIAVRADRPVVFQSRKRTLSGPYTVVFTGSAASHRALQLGAELALQEDSFVRVLAAGEELAAEAAGVMQSTFAEAKSAVGLAATVEELLAAVDDAGVVLLPTDVAQWLDLVGITVIVIP
jgi:hypothetical protein